jgi:small subunit ribosomal protein S8
MSTQHPTSDFLTRIRNAIKARHLTILDTFSKVKLCITTILYEEGYILNYKVVVDENQPNKKYIKIALKYFKSSSTDFKKPCINSIKVGSKPSLSVYCKKSNLPRVINGFGTAIISTSSGIMTNKKAKKLGIGGEVLCYVY